MTDAPTFLAVVPAIDREVTRGCVDSLGLTPDTLVVIDNAAGECSGLWPRTHSPLDGENAGCARSWNLAARRVIRDGLQYLVIVSASIRGDVGGWLTQATVDPARPPVVESHEGWHLIALHRTTIEAVGLFDETFWPAYFEDQDYIVRLWLAGLLHLDGGEKWERVRVPEVPARCFVHGGIERATPDAHALTSGRVRVNMGMLQRYLRAKWGIDPLPYGDLPAMRRSLAKLYRHPFGDERNPLRWWAPTSVAQLAERYGVPAKVGATPVVG